MTFTSKLGSVGNIVAVRGARDEAIGQELEPLRAVDDVRLKYADLVASGELTAIGLADRRKKLADTGGATLATFEQGTRTLQTELERDEEDAIRSRVQVSSEDRTLISNWIVALPPERRIPEYFAALSAGDERTVAVFENLPPSVSPLTDAARQTARARKLARIDPSVATSLERTRARLGARLHAELAARRILNELRGNP